MTIDNPFRGPDDEVPDLSSPQAQLDAIHKVADEMNATMARLVTGEIEPLDLIVEALSANFAVLEIAEAQLLAQGVDAL